jgi:hypothetical protein
MTDATIETILFVGALVGLTTGIFILLGRLLHGRPVVTITPSKHTRDLRFQNLSKHAILLLSIHCWPRWVRIARDDTPEGTAAAAAHQTFSVILQAWEILNFPIVIQRGELLDTKNSKAWGPLVIWVHWRKTSSVWLPQVPKIIFSSAKILRHLGYSAGHYRNALRRSDHLSPT